MSKKPLPPDRRAENDKLKAIYEAKKRSLGLTHTAIADALNIGQSGVSHYLNGINALNAAAAATFARLLEVDVAEFSPRLAREIEQLSAATNVSPGPSIKGRLPLISWVQAGEWCEAVDIFQPGDAEEWVPCPFEHSDSAFCLTVVGQSMWPDYREGEIIAVDPEVSARHGDDVVCRAPDGTVTFKRLQITPEGTYLLAVNPDWPERMIKVPDDTHICGVVIGSWMRRRR